MINKIRKKIIETTISIVRNIPSKYLNMKLDDILLMRRYKYPLVNEEELSEQYMNAIHYLTNELDEGNLGDYLEFGVCLGSSIKCLNTILNDASVHEMRIFGFDSFEGLPHDNEGMWDEGLFKADYEITKKFLTKNGVDWNRIKLTKGWFADTLTNEFVQKNNIKKASLIMIDCDIYQGAKEALEFCAQLIVDKSIIVFDDWNPLAKQNKGEKRAFDEFLESHPQFRVEEFGEYNYQPGDLNGKVFIVSNEC